MKRTSLAVVLLAVIAFPWFTTYSQNNQDPKKYDGWIYLAQYTMYQSYDPSHPDKNKDKNAIAVSDVFYVKDLLNGNRMRAIMDQVEIQFRQEVKTRYPGYYWDHYYYKMGKTENEVLRERRSFISSETSNGVKVLQFIFDFYK